MPGFKYASFISYRHGQSQIKETFIEHFRRGLTDELEMLRNEGVFVDKGRLKGGDFYNEALARALYESATLIVVYHPSYFDPSHPYCAREYKGMRSLEVHRLSQLTNEEERQHGLIIPVVLRGFEGIPPELKDCRQCEDFSRFSLMDELSKHPEYTPRIRGIAEYIHARCQCLEEAHVPFEDAETFQLPDEDETRQWIMGLNLSEVSFPGAGKT